MKRILSLAPSVERKGPPVKATTTKKKSKWCFFFLVLIQCFFIPAQLSLWLFIFISAVYLFVFFKVLSPSFFWFRCFYILLRLVQSAPVYHVVSDSVVISSFWFSIFKIFFLLSRHLTGEEKKTPMRLFQFLFFFVPN